MIKKINFMIVLSLLLLLSSCDDSHICKYDRMNTNLKYLISPATCESKAKYTYSCLCGKAGTETFESGETAEHNSLGKINTESYLACPANCCSPALYYCCCSWCGKRSIETFQYGVCKSHNFEKKVVNSDTRVPNQEYSCVIPVRYYYSCECGAISDFEMFELDACLSHRFIETVDDQYIASSTDSNGNKLYYKHCLFCGALSEETFVVNDRVTDPETDSESNPGNNDIYYDETEVLEAGSSKEICIDAGDVYIYKLGLYGTSFGYETTPSLSSLTCVQFKLFSESECENEIEPDVYSDFLSEDFYWLKITATQYSEFTFTII